MDNVVPGLRLYMVRVCHTLSIQVLCILLCELDIYTAVIMKWKFLLINK